MSCNFQEGEVLEVVRVAERGDRVTSCIDSEGNVVVSTVYKTAMKESLEEKEGDKEWEEKEEVDTAKEVWVAEGEARKENLVLPGGREATALYQVPSLFRSKISQYCCHQPGREAGEIAAPGGLQEAPFSLH